MSIAEAVQAAIRPDLCRFGEILHQLAEDDAVAISNGFIAGLTAADAARILASHGHSVSQTVAKSHRRGECRCKDAK